MKTQLWLIFCVFLAFFFLLFRVWPEWLKVGVWYISWYTLVALVSAPPISAPSSPPPPSVEQSSLHGSSFACYGPSGHQSTHK